MQFGPASSSCLAPLLHSAPAQGYALPPTIRLPSLAPRLPTLPALMNSLSSQQYDPAAPSRNQSSISFLLNPSPDAQPQAQAATYPFASSQQRSPVAQGFTHDRPVEPKVQPKKKRKTRICKSDGCEKYVVDSGLCIRHGGGKRCSVEDCNCRAQNRGLCWKHGGYTRCTVEGCTKRAKSRGICWSHGGGTRCKHGGCSKIAVSHGLCWAHGGGKRCLVETCQKPAYERNGNLCSEHCALRSQSAAASASASASGMLSV